MAMAEPKPARLLFNPGCRAQTGSSFRKGLELPRASPVGGVTHRARLLPPRLPPQL